MVESKEYLERIEEELKALDGVSMYATNSWWQMHEVLASIEDECVRQDEIPQE